MVPNTYVIEFDESLYGPFPTAAEACKYAIDRGYSTFALLELKAP